MSVVLDHPVLPLTGCRIRYLTANLVRHARVKQNPLRGRGLTGIDMGDDANVPIPRYRCRTCHRVIPWILVGG